MRKSAVDRVISGPAGKGYRRRRNAIRGTLEHEEDLPAARLDAVCRDSLIGGTRFHRARLHLELRSVPRALDRPAHQASTGE
jgi:hypothetical protein